MPEKERARLKEQYVKELRERKRIQRTLATVRRKRMADRALGNMVETLTGTGDTVDEFTAHLDADTALNEARLEIALEQDSRAQTVTEEESSVHTGELPSKTIGPRLSTSSSDKNV